MGQLDGSERSRKLRNKYWQLTGDGTPHRVSKERPRKESNDQHPIQQNDKPGDVKIDGARGRGYVDYSVIDAKEKNSYRAKEPVRPEGHGEAGFVRRFLKAMDVLLEGSKWR
jgi:hypothetical protein